MADKIQDHEIPKLLKDPLSRQYLPGTALGKGGFATVYRAKIVDRRHAPESSECALKVVRRNIKSEQLRTRFKFELGIHSKLHHPNIVSFHRAFTSGDLTYVSLELCENGSLTDMVKRRKFLTMGEIRRFLIQLCGAVKYLSGRDIVHRDIKAGNIFLDADMNVKLGDFGLASIMLPKDGIGTQYMRRTTFCGTPNYLAPELLSRSGHNTSVDIWAIGILAYYLSVGKAPFHSKSKEDIYERIRKADYAWPEPGPEANDIADELKDLVSTLLVPEDQRPTPDQIVQHPFFSQGFVPERIDPLARTRRPRWARMPASALPCTTSVYDALCRQSRVGAGPFAVPASRSGRSVNQDGEKILLTLEKEFSKGISLEIPLPEGVCYKAWRPEKRKAAAIIYEDPEESAAARVETGLAARPPRKLSAEGVKLMVEESNRQLREVTGNRGAMAPPERPKRRKAMMAE